MTGETVLYYHPDGGEKNSSLTRVLFRMKIRMRRVKPEESGQIIGVLAGLPGFREGNAGSDEAAPAADLPGGAVPEEMLIFSGLTDSRLTELLTQLRKAGVRSSLLKAVVTPTSCHWTLRQLYQELAGERAAFAAQAAQTAQGEQTVAQTAQAVDQGRDGRKERSRC